MPDTLSIGEVARRAGVATSALRYYERVGLVRASCRDGSGRRYHPDALVRLTIIKYLQHAGFSLREVSELLDGASGWQRLARQKREELAARIRELAEAQRLIDAALACGCEDLEGCSAHGEACDPG